MRALRPVWRHTSTPVPHVWFWWRDCDEYTKIMDRGVSLNKIILSASSEEFGSFADQLSCTMLESTILQFPYGVAVSSAEGGKFMHPTIFDILIGPLCSLTAISLLTISW
jgi:hypothetical protein